MKKVFSAAIALLLITCLLTSCVSLRPTDPTDTKPITSSADPTADPTSKPSSGPTSDPTAEEDLTAYYIEEVYSEQINRYYTALWALWEAEDYLAHEMNTTVSRYSVGNPLENVGFSLTDLDADGTPELIIGAIYNSDENPAVFEIWTLADGVPAMIAQGSTKSDYVLQHTEDGWFIANKHIIHLSAYAMYYMKLDGGSLNLVQGILYDEFGGADTYWFKTDDFDGAASNDTPIDEKTATSVIESNKQYYTAPEYIPYTEYHAKYGGTSDTSPVQWLFRRADELSDRFGVTITVPEQSELAYPCYDAYALTDLIAIKAALDVIEEIFSLYPQGFFKQLVYGTIESVRLDLVKTLVVQEGSGLDPSSTRAFAQNNIDHYLIVFTADAIDLNTIAHEFSHLTDARLAWDALNRENALFSEQAWFELQPAGFNYTMSYVYVPDYMLRYLEGDDFVSPYSLTFPTEDRAELLTAAVERKEYLFDKSSGRYAKLQFYADCIRDCFNTEGWPETTIWEQLLR